MNFIVIYCKKNSDEEFSAMQTASSLNEFIVKLYNIRDIKEFGNFKSIHFKINGMSYKINNLALLYLSYCQKIESNIIKEFELL